MRNSAFFAMAAVCFALAAPAIAQSQESEARALGDRAGAAMLRRHFHEALDLYERAQALAPSPFYLLGVARAEAEVGKLSSAHRHYQEFLAASETATWGALVSAGDEARSEAADVASRLAHVTITLNAVDAPQLALDGARLDAATGQEIDIDPGPHGVVATAKGCAPAEARFSVIEGGHATVALALAGCRSSASAETSGPLSADGAAPSTGTGTQRMLGWTAIGVGGAALATGVIAAVVVMRDRAELATVCANQMCPRAAIDRLSVTQRWATIANVSFIAGLIGVGTGTLLVLTAPRVSAKPVPYVGFGTVGVVGRF
jgi:hypothetical protein